MALRHEQGAAPTWRRCKLSPCPLIHLEIYFLRTHAKTPEHYLIAHSDGGARGNPGPAGYGVVIQDEAGRKVAALSQYLGHQTNNFAEYQGLIAALEYAIEHGHKALKLVSDSELLVRQIKGIYKVKNSTLQELHGRAKQLIAQLEWFSIDHALREHNREADDWPTKPWTKAQAVWRGRPRPRLFPQWRKNLKESCRGEWSSSTENCRREPGCR